MIAIVETMLEEVTITLNDKGELRFIGSKTRKETMTNNTEEQLYWVSHFSLVGRVKSGDLEEIKNKILKLKENVNNDNE